MRAALFAALLMGASLAAQSQTLSVFYDTVPNSQKPISQFQPLPSTYAFPNTPIGSSSGITIALVNPSTSAVEILGVFLVASPTSTADAPGFTIQSAPHAITLAPQAPVIFTVSFAPLNMGSAGGYLQFQSQINGPITTFSNLQGNATAPQLALSCSGPPSLCNGSILQPSSPAPLSFGSVLTTATSTVVFTLTNHTATPLAVAVSLSAGQFINTPFALDVSSLPATIDANSSGHFSVTFAPGIPRTFQASLNAGSNSYGLQGTGTASATGDISSLVVTYVDYTGASQTAQGTPIDFGQVVGGTGAPAPMTFTVTNPSITIYPVSANFQLSGTGFSSSDIPPGSVTIAAGQSVSFHIAFSGSAAGTYAGTLSVGTRQFHLQAQALAPLVPSATFAVDVQPLTSQRQAHLSIQLSTAPSSALIGTLTMQFASSVANISDDPAINFVATSGRQLSVTVPAGSQSATFNGQSALTFQTGATAGTLTFTLQFPNSAPLTQSYDITPAQVQITSTSAVRQAPNLIVTLTGYDNTYSAGQLSFAFSTTTAGTITVPVDATSAFHQYFFTDNRTGGAFRLQASFPMSGGDVTQVGSVSVNLTNSAGQTSANQSFQ
jgi:hypothetical protein